MPVKCIKKSNQLGIIILVPILLLLIFFAQLTKQVKAQEKIHDTGNVVSNGNFELGYYPVHELGFEPNEIGNIPIDWSWYRSQAYGKYKIDNNEGFGLLCPDDVDTIFAGSKNSLSFYMQSTDQPDARLGVYQTIDVTPGQDYLFVISGTIQVQKGGSSPDINHRVQLAFDQTGGVDWQAIPQEQWTNLPWPEEELEFEVSGPHDPDLATVRSYLSVVRASSDKMTIFITGWRRWPNWRTSIFTFDCVSLKPLNRIDVPAVVPQLSQQSTTEVDQALEASARVQPESALTTTEAAVVPVTGSEIAPATEPAIIPPSGGILETKGNAILITVISVIVISGLVGAGIWNIQRRKK